MNLQELSSVIGASAPAGFDLSIKDIAYDARMVTPGSVFFCIVGRTYDGHAFAQDAVSRGAVALIASRHLDLGVPVLVVPDARVAMSNLASAFFGHPSRSLLLFGVTGTNGKTTVCFMLESIASATGQPTGLIGTVKTLVAGESQPGIRTTPESPDIQRLLARMVASGVALCAMEVTSEGLAEGRLQGCRFDLVAFTNLSQDHLNYHGDMESYFRAKSALFDPDRARIGLVNVDDPAGRRLVEETSLKSSTFAVDREADFIAADVSMSPNGSSFRVLGPGIDLGVSIRMPGPFNVSNALCAASAAHLMGISHDAIPIGLGLDGVPGRFETVEVGQAFAVIVDYAHSPDSLANVLSAARSITEGRLIVVFGCGGDRDRGKRPLMGEAAGRGADLVIATSDNPRSEDPVQILKQVEEGLARTSPPDGYRLIVDRREAIDAALREAREGDAVVIAGKGHETGQETDGVITDFDDRTVAIEILRDIL